jgi:translation elongation factor EF-Tu-like GTPase
MMSSALYDRPADAQVLFELLASEHGGRTSGVTSGYLPAYALRADYWTSVRHEFIDADTVEPGERAQALVWFVAPEVYPGCVWADRMFDVAEGQRRVAIATVVEVFNAVLARGPASAER